MLFWTSHFFALDSTFFVLDSTFWLDSTLKIDPAHKGDTITPINVVLGTLQCQVPRSRNHGCRSVGIQHYSLKPSKLMTVIVHLSRFIQLGFKNVFKCMEYDSAPNEDPLWDFRAPYPLPPVSLFQSSQIRHCV